MQWDHESRFASLEALCTCPSSRTHRLLRSTEVARRMVHDPALNMAPAAIPRDYQRYTLSLDPDPSALI